MQPQRIPLGAVPPDPKWWQFARRLKWWREIRRLRRQFRSATKHGHTTILGGDEEHG